jgi:hypothetical protein
MQYFVITQAGQKFGPADVHVLTQWVQEGRIIPSTQLQDAATGQVVVANQVAGLGFPAPGNYYAGVQPSPANYPRIVDTAGDKLAKTAKALGYTGFFVCPLLCLVGIGFAVGAFHHKSARARSAMTVCVGALLLQVLLYALFYGILMSAVGSVGT